ncbi:unnamed protein product [Porites evermanni]|uniref:Uncharacterized protein n=1 Tax=Porites evermanni TaxID=104178 RepID=A0ABN8MCH3_9CNID|nr:unnamed protein product [Porites evermanni]
MPEKTHGQSSSKRTFSSIFPESVKHSVCFFCEESANVGDLRMACTMDIDSRVRSVVRKLSDFRLIFKLNTTDMSGRPPFCLKFLVMRAREHDKESSSELNSQSEAHSMVLADLIAEIQNSRHGQPHITVFKLSDLRKEYCKRLIREGLAEETQEIHSTRLKEKLIEAIPGFKTAHSKGRELGVVSFYRRYIGTIVSDAFSNDNDANEMCLQRAASILREEMFTESYVVNGSFSQNCQRGSIPQTLLSLVNMILEGPKAKYQSTIKPEECTRYVKSQETPLPVYIGVVLHLKTLKRDLIDRLHSLGLSISYDEMLRLSSDVANAVCEHFKETDTVCPPNLKTNVFTTAAVDNIDHNTSSTTAVS